MAKKRQASAAPRSSLRSINVPVTLGANSVANTSRNIRTSNTILSAMGKKLSMSGVVVKIESGVPTFTADRKNPDKVVRSLRGQKVRGHFVQGHFKKG